MARRIIAAVVAVLLAAVGTFVLVAYVRTAEDRALAGEETVEVLVVAEEIERGTAAASIGVTQVRSERVPVKVQTAGSVASLEELDGRVAAVDLLPGEQITEQRFISLAELQAQPQVDIPDGLLQVTVSLSPERAVGGQVRPGSTVAVFASFDPFEVGGILETDEGFEEPDAEDGRSDARTPNTTHLLQHKVLVTNVQVEQLPAQPEVLGDPDEGPAAAQPDLAPADNLLVTLAVPAPAAEEIVFAAEFGHLWLSDEPADAPEDGTQIQTRDTIYR